MHYIDIIFFVIVILFALIGLAKGLFESLLSIFGTVLSVLIAIWVSRPVANFINGLVNTDKFFIKLLTDWGVIGENGLVSAFTKTWTAEQAGSFCTIVLAVILVWLLIKLAVILLSKLFDSATSNSSALSGMNRLLGLVFGAAKGLLIACVGFGLISALNVFGVTKNLVQEIKKDAPVSNFVFKYVNDFVLDELGKRIDDLVGESIPEDQNNEEDDDTIESRRQDAEVVVTSECDNLHLGPINCGRLQLHKQHCR